MAEHSQRRRRRPLLALNDPAIAHPCAIHPFALRYMGGLVDRSVARILTFIFPEGISMLWTLFMVLVILWLLGVATSYTAGGLIHLLLVVAVVVMLIRVIQGRRPV